MSVTSSPVGIVTALRAAASPLSSWTGTPACALCLSAQLLSFSCLAFLIEACAKSVQVWLAAAKSEGEKDRGGAGQHQQACCGPCRPSDKKVKRGRVKRGEKDTVAHAHVRAAQGTSTG